LVATAASAQDDDTVLKPAEPDFTVVGLPTSLPLAKWKSDFRLTHRFARPLGDGDFGDLADDFFGLDNGAIVGLEYRIGVAPRTQASVHRSSNGKTIQFLGEYTATRQSAEMPFESAILVSVDGQDNFRKQYAPGLGVVLTRMFNDAAAVHVEPIWVGNTNSIEGADQDSTFVIGLGGRLRFRPTAYLVAEWVPRVSGYKPGVDHVAFGIEKRAGGHMFQLNFSNSWSTTIGQLATGGFNNNDWYLGFNLTRKFF
jgi:hypothetical protein